MGGFYEETCYLNNCSSQAREELFKLRKKTYHPSMARLSSWSFCQLALHSLLFSCSLTLYFPIQAVHPNQSGYASALVIVMMISVAASAWLISGAWWEFTVGALCGDQRWEGIWSSWKSREAGVGVQRKGVRARKWDEDAILDPMSPLKDLGLCTTNDRKLLEILKNKWWNNIFSLKLLFWLLYEEQVGRKQM